MAGMTAWQALFDRGGLESGQTVLIAGGAGGVGHLAVQFAKVAGARVIATGSSDNRDFVLGLGADEYVDYTQQDVAQAVNGVDVAFDTVGGDTTASVVPIVREGGVVVTIANAPPEEAAGARGARAELLGYEPPPRPARANCRARGSRRGPRGDRGGAPLRGGRRGTSSARPDTCAARSSSTSESPARGIFAR